MGRIRARVFLRVRPVCEVSKTRGLERRTPIRHVSNSSSLALHRRAALLHAVALVALQRVAPRRAAQRPRGAAHSVRSTRTGLSQRDKHHLSPKYARASARFDSRRRVWSACPQQPKSGLLPQAGRGGTNFPGFAGADAGTGRTAPGNRGPGHFQGQARQLTSQAFGRASFQGRESGFHGLPRHKQERRTPVIWPVSVSSSCDRELAGGRLCGR